MDRERLADIFSWLAIALFGLAAVLRFVPVLTWKAPVIVAFFFMLAWAWLLSTKGKPVRLDARLDALNVTSGSLMIDGGAVLVGDQWAPARNKQRLVIEGAEEIRYEVTVRHGLVTKLVLRPVRGTFAAARLEIPVDTGFIAIFDDAWQSRGIDEKSVSADVLAVLRADRPLHLAIVDAQGRPAGVVVGSGEGDGIYEFECTATEAGIRFHESS